METPFTCIAMFCLCSLVRSLKFHDETQTCTIENSDTQVNFHFRGVNLGSWMVLEPWITPSMFYQFLGLTDTFKDDVINRIGMDMYTFCKALGPEEANVQLRRHWRTWITEEDIKKLSDFGLNSVRVPVGDWMYIPYDHFGDCTNGSLEEMDVGMRLLDLCEKYGLSVVIDIHGVKGSQNGFDNSGMSHRIEWTSWGSIDPLGVATFMHWPIRSAEWIGSWDRYSRSYKDINEDNIQHLLDVIRTICERYKDHPAVVGLETLNEPWQFTPLDSLKRVYWEGYKIVESITPHWVYIMHDSFRYDIAVWGTFMTGCPNKFLDTHIYQAWMEPTSKNVFIANACAQTNKIKEMEERGMPVIVGEWSLATDNCAMWLNGFNDNLPGFPRVICDYKICPPPYMGSEQPGAPPDSNSGPKGPFGSGFSTPSFGLCPVDAKWPNEEIYMPQLALAKLHAFESGSGWFFWNFKTELEEKWSYIAAVESGWMSKNATILDDPAYDIVKACNNLKPSTHPIPIDSTTTNAFILPKRSSSTSIAAVNARPAFSVLLVFFLTAAVLLLVWELRKRSRRRYVEISSTC